MLRHDICNGNSQAKCGTFLIILFSIMYSNNVTVPASHSSTIGSPISMRIEMVAWIELQPWPPLSIFRVDDQQAYMPAVRLFHNVRFYFLIIHSTITTCILRPLLIELCEEFDRLINPGTSNVQHERESLVKQQRKDLFCLGSLLDGILGPKEISVCAESQSPDYSSSNPDAVDFIAACQTAKNVEQLADHKYLIQGSFIQFFKPE